MNDNSQRPARRSPRLKGYDYSQEGAYFITICTQDRLHLFGAVIEGEMHLNAAGLMVAHWWEELSHKYAAVEIDLYRVMPNHFHGIVAIVDGEGTPPSVGADLRVRPSLPTIIQWFKTMTTNAYLRGVRERNWESFRSKLWQRSFHDHIIRSERSLDALRAYTDTNPMRWESDEFYGKGHHPRE